MKNIRANSLQSGDTLVCRNPTEEDTFVIMEGDNPDHWNVLVIATDMNNVHFGLQLYAVGCVMRSWIHKGNVLSGEYDVYRGGSLLLPSG